MDDEITIYACARFGAIFGGNNLEFRETIEGEEVHCPVCGEWHLVINNTQNLEEMNFGQV
jgi:DNA-directed RNA polymerase subunit RPC12/RpoP